jgi:hypothetical protein
LLPVLKLHCSVWSRIGRRRFRRVNPTPSEAVTVAADLARSLRLLSVVAARNSRLLRMRA